MPIRCARPGQAGLSLIELMIAMTLSAFLILGVTQVFIDNQKNNLFLNGQTQNQDNGRYITARLQSRLDKAGYRRLPSNKMADAFPAASTAITLSTTPATTKTCAFSAGQTVARADGSTLCLRYQPRDASDRDCTGKRLSGVAGVGTPYGTFSASNDVVEAIALVDNTLVCGASTQDSSATLAENVMGVRFDYGVDESADESDRQVTRYTATPGSSDVVRSLRYAFLLDSAQKNVTASMDSSSCSNWTSIGGSTSNCSDANGALHAIVTGSVALRNLMP
jgi:type IV pilus assembly protein PilW